MDADTGRGVVLDAHFHPVAIVEVQPVIHILQADPRGGVSGFLAFLWCKLLVQEGNLLFPDVADVVEKLKEELPSDWRLPEMTTTFSWLSF